MTVLNEKSQLNIKTVVAMGYFDSVHIGHRAVIGRACVVAREKGFKSAVFTFADNVKGGGQVYLPDERISLFEQIGVDYVILYPFDDAVKNTSPLSFLDDLTARIDVGAFVCGADYTFGKNKSGNVGLLKEYCDGKGIDLFVEPEVNAWDVRVSTSRIKQELSAGKIQSANTLLASPYFIMGSVVGGRGDGRRYGFPTANLSFSEQKYLPACGVYSTLAHTDKGTYTAVANIGKKPTFGDDSVSVEAMLLDFDGDLYGSVVKLEFYNFLRGIKRFDSPDKLKAQIDADIAITLDFFKMC